MSSERENNRLNEPAEIDRNTTLCLACSCSLPPFRNGLTSPTGDTPAQSYLAFLQKKGFFITPCCNRPICPSCARANSRLTRYNPCLSCLAGVDAAASTSAPNSASSHGRNVDGAVRDEDTYVVGDDEEDEDNLPPVYDDAADSDLVRNPWASTPSIPHTTPSSNTPFSPAAATSVPEPPSEPQQPQGSAGPSKYYLNKRDTLQGLALRFGVDGRELCRINKLPISTMNTTPHLLHTRSYIMLPFAVPSWDQNDEEVKAREARRAREKAEKKLQILMKEADPAIAKAYVALVDDDEPREAIQMKRKEMQGGRSRANANDGSLLEQAAIEQYLDDEDWENSERRLGRGPGASRNPPVKV